MITLFFIFLDLAFASKEPQFKIDCPFFLKWSADWETCMVQWNTFYGLAIVLAVIVFIVATTLVTLWMIYRKKTDPSG